MFFFSNKLDLNQETRPTILQNEFEWGMRWCQCLPCTKIGAADFCSKVHLPIRQNPNISTQLLFNIATVLIAGFQWKWFLTFFRGSCQTVGRKPTFEKRKSKLPRSDLPDSRKAEEETWQLSDYSAGERERAQWLQVKEIYYRMSVFVRPVSYCLILY